MDSADGIQTLDPLADNPTRYPLGHSATAGMPMAIAHDRIPSGAGSFTIVSPNTLQSMKQLITVISVSLSRQRCINRL